MHPERLFDGLSPPEWTPTCAAQPLIRRFKSNRLSSALTIALSTVLSLWWASGMVFYLLMRLTWASLSSPTHGFCGEMESGRSSKTSRSVPKKPPASSTLQPRLTTTRSQKSLYFITTSMTTSSPRSLQGLPQNQSAGKENLMITLMSGCAFRMPKNLRRFLYRCQATTWELYTTPRSFYPSTATPTTRYRRGATPSAPIFIQKIGITSTW